MANSKPIFQSKPSPSGVSIVNADGTTPKTLYIAGTEGALLDNISVTSTDTSTVILALTYNDGSNDFQLGEISVPAGAGTDGSTPSVNMMDANYLPFLQSRGGLPLGASHLLKVNAKSAVTTAKAIDIVAFGGNY